MNESSCSINSAVFTLDPQHKYLTPRPPTPKPVLTDDCATARKEISAQVCAQLLGMARYSANRANKSLQELPQAVPIPSGEASKEPRRVPSLAFRQSSLMAVFHRLRGTKSAEYRRESNTANSFQHHGKGPASMRKFLKPFERSTKSADGGRSTSKITSSHAKLLARDNLLALPSSRHTVFPSLYAYPTKPDLIPGKLNVAPPNTPLPSKSKRSEFGASSSSQAEEIQSNTPKRNPGSGIVPSESWNLYDNQTCQPPDERKPKVSTGSDPYTRSSRAKERTLNIAEAYTRQSSLDELRDGAHSPGLGVMTVRSGSSSPRCLSEPGSPFSPDLDHQQISIKDGSVADGAFEDHDCPAWHTHALADRRYDNTRSLDRPSPQPFFAGYSLPQPEHSSALTIKQPQLNPFRNLNSNPFHNGHGEHNIQVLDSSPPFRMTALEELVDDLGYLGQAII